MILRDLVTYGPAYQFMSIKMARLPFDLQAWMRNLCTAGRMDNFVSCKCMCIFAHHFLSIEKIAGIKSDEKSTDSTVSASACTCLSMSLALLPRYLRKYSLQDEQNPWVATYDVSTHIQTSCHA